MGQKDKKNRKLIANRNKQRKFVAKYSNYNIPSKFIEKDPPQTQPVNPEPPKPEIKEFYTKLSERMDSTEISAQVNSEITEIIKASGITEQDVDKFAEKSYSDIREHVKFIYDPNAVSETKMSIDAPSFFYVAYQSLMESNLSAPEQIIAAQKIANVMIKNYSPVAFADKGLDHYANDYVLNNKEYLKIQLEALGFLDTNAMMEEVYATLRGEPIKKPEPPKQEPQKQDAPDRDMVDIAAFFKGMQQMENDTEQYNNYTVFLKLAIKNTLKDAGVDVGEESDPLGYADVISDAYAPEKLSREALQPMRDVAKSLFISTYNALTQKGINPPNKIETTQKITNELIKRYSPAFVDDNLSKYADNYVTNDKELLRECLTALKLPENEIEAIINKIEPNQNMDMVDGTRLRDNVQFFLGMPSLNARINSGISDILKAASVGADKINALEINEILADAYTPEKIPNGSVHMRDVAKHVFMSTYDAMTKKGVTPRNKVETAQKIADQLLKNYSPAAYTDQKLNKYTDNYVTGDKALLRECLTTLQVPENEINAIVGDKEEKKVVNTDSKVQNKKNDAKRQQQKEIKPVSDEARIAVYTEKLKTYNNMYRLDVDSNHFASSVTEAWDLMTSSDKQNVAKGQKVMNDIFKDTLKKAFDVEKDVAYNEHRLPEYAEIINSTNELMRSAMYGFTDMYHNPDRKDLFAATAFGGLNAKDIGELTTGKSLWSMDQKSDEAWDVQAKEAKDIADKWLKEDKPYEKMINEMNALVKDKKRDNLDLRQAYNKLTAAEWLLTNNEKMMVEDPSDPLNPIPNWGNRYWKTLTETREALGIPKHTSMRDLIQLDYEESAKAVENRTYNEKQIFDGVLDPADREMHDSLDMQKEQFAIRSAAVVINGSHNDKTDEKTVENPENKLRWQISVTNEDERKKMKNEPKVFGNMVIEKANEIKLDAVREDMR